MLNVRLPVWKIAAHLAVACHVFIDVSLCCPFSPRDVLDGIFDLIGSVSDGFPTYFPTFYWIRKLHKQPYKARLIANSSSCTSIELSKLLTSCLTTAVNPLYNGTHYNRKFFITSF